MEIDVPDGSASVLPRPGKLPPRPNLAETCQRLGALILALERGDIRFGAAKTRGLGRLTLADARVARLDLGNRGGMLACLKGVTAPSPALRDELTKEAASASHGGVEIVIAWRPELPVMNKSDAEGVSVDALPLVSAAGDQLQPVITGASIKGVLRTHAERICRTIAPPQPQQGDDGTPSDDLAECALAQALFGSPGEQRTEEKRYDNVRTDVAVPGLGAVSVDDCVIDKPITRPAWRELLTTSHNEATQEKTGAVRELLDRSASAWREFRPATHVAIDRWTGGAAENLLLARLEPGVDSTYAFRMGLDLERIAPPWADRYHHEKEAPEQKTRREREIAAFRQARLRCSW
jgi:CRISPR/Cas system CSM-associated protein Csm3 (group 7 of RAMP superfamily)